MATMCSRGGDWAALACNDLECFSRELGVRSGWVEVLYRYGRPFRADLFLRGIPLDGSETYPHGRIDAGGPPHEVPRWLQDFAVRRAGGCRILFGSLIFRLDRDGVQVIEARERFKIASELERFALLYSDQVNTTGHGPLARPSEAARTPES